MMDALPSINTTPAAVHSTCKGVSHGEARYNEWFSDIDQSHDYAPIIDSRSKASDTPGIESKANNDDGEDGKSYTVSDEYWFRVLVECAG